ncbi:MAG: protein kinase [Myxococcales bacterium]|nr:protein kinase [Myxococcales bacterium]
MDCLSEGRIQGIVEGGLDTSERTKAREHLENCAECRKLVGHAASLLASAESGESDQDPLGVALQALEPGERIGRYVVSEALGSGAMGVVYAATDTLLKRQVALKLLRPSDGGVGVERGRLEREAQAACAVKHPGVVAVHDVLTTDDGASVLVMDRLDGISMRQYLRERGRLQGHEVRSLFVQILDALAAAHAKGVVHRDLKPENVFLTHDAAGGTQVKLLDFGVAKLLAGSFSDAAGLTKSGTLVGTPYYMAPEQAFGATDLDQRADLWAVGVMLFEALVGERPLRGENVGQVLHRLAHFDFSVPRARLLEVAPAWEPLIARLMVERAARLESAQQALDVLRSIDAGRTSPHLPPGAPLTPKKSRWWVIPLALGAVAAAGFGFTSSSGTPEKPAPQPAETGSPVGDALGALPTATPGSLAPPAPVAEPVAPAALISPEPRAKARPSRAHHKPAAAASTRAEPAPAPSGRAPRLLTEPPF